MDRIYSRKRFVLKDIDIRDKKNIKKYVKFMAIILIAVGIANRIIYSIEPIIDVMCTDIAKSVATKISNEQASIVMRKL